MCTSPCTKFRPNLSYPSEVTHETNFTSVLQQSWWTKTVNISSVLLTMLLKLTFSQAKIHAIKPFNVDRRIKFTGPLCSGPLQTLRAPAMQRSDRSNSVDLRVPGRCERYARPRCSAETTSVLRGLRKPAFTTSLTPATGPPVRSATWYYPPLFYLYSIDLPGLEWPN